MNSFVVFALVMVVASAQHYQHGNSGAAHYVDDHYAPANYNFEYNVHDTHTGDIKSQHESRHGDVVKGYYTLKEADGTTREVHYTADDHHGFNAEVKKSGHAVHQPTYHHQQPLAHY